MSTETGKLEHYCLSRESLDYRDVLSWSRVFSRINTIARMLEAHQLPWWLPARTGLVVVVLHHKVSSSVLLHADVSIIRAERALLAVGEDADAFRRDS